MWVLCVFGLASEHSIPLRVPDSDANVPSGRYARLGRREGAGNIDQSMALSI